MLLRECITIRSVFLLLVMLVGLFIGFTYDRSSPAIPWQNKISKKSIKRYFTYRSDSGAEIKFSMEEGFVLENIEIPEYKEGVLHTLIKAKRAEYTSGNTIQLNDMVVYEFAPGGEMIVKVLEGELGEIHFDSLGNLLSIGVSGRNTRICVLSKPERYSGLK